MKHILTFSLLGAAVLTASLGFAADRSKYVNAGATGHELIYAMRNWQPGQKWCDDDNFYISRVRPKERFRNLKTQIVESLTETTDKHLVYWVPIGTPPYNALPVPTFDADNFNMWQYVTHYGNWNCGLMRCPATFTDAAHKNGVGVSTLISTPFGLMSEAWGKALTELTDQGPENWAEYMKWYGLDGLSYNSEFQYPSTMYEGVPGDLVYRMADFNAGLTRLAQTSSPAYVNIWYDGTNKDGKITFDNGVGEHNGVNFGDSKNPATSLFLNYNWNRIDLDASLAYVKSLGRDPRDIYCGFNMQGKEPGPAYPVWTLMEKYPFSIGLWGAHSESMMFESRNERGSAPDKRQSTYLLRNERFWSGGTRNPVTRPAVTDDWGYHAENVNFFGMASFVSARSPLCWNLDNEPFITYFNLGNGKYFNLNGERNDSHEWTNIAIQDYLPTWRFWWSKKFLGKNPNDVAHKGLEANFTWDDAYFGGSSLQISGNTKEEFLHLFKTRYQLQSDDEITLTYKLKGGNSQLRFALSAEGNEEKPLLSSNILRYEDIDQQWHTITFTVGTDFPELSGKSLAMIALKFDWAENLQLTLGGLSLHRPGAASTTPVMPIIEKAEPLAFTKEGIDAKLIFNMPNTVTGRVCYNDDVNTSMFKIYYQQKGEQPQLKTFSTTWAAIIYCADLNPTGEKEIRFGVSALSLDRKTESDIAWSEYFDFSELHEPDYNLTVSNREPFIGEEVTISSSDPYMSEPLDFIVTDSDNKVISTATGTSITLPNGFEKAGFYTVKIKQGEIEREFIGFLQVLDPSSARAPKIENITFEPKEEFSDPADASADASEEYDILAGQTFEYSYIGRQADGKRSRGLHMEGFGFGMRKEDVGFSNTQPFSIAFWVCPQNMGATTQIISLRDKTNIWPKNEYGMFRQVYNPQSRTLQTSITIKQLLEGTYTFTYNNVDIPENGWTHLAYSFDFNKSRWLDFQMALNGKVLTPTGWKLDAESGEGHPGAVGPMPVMTEHHVLAVGGALHMNGGVEGYIDQVQYFDKALSKEELSDCYNAFGKYNPDGHLKLFFDFDSEPLEDYSFESSHKSDLDAHAGMIQYVADFAEGTGNARWAKSNFGPGAPGAQTDRVVTTKAIWDIPGATIKSQNDGDTSGSASGTFQKIGNFKATLTLVNDCGADTRQYDFVRVAAGVHVQGVAEENANATPSYNIQGNTLMLWISGNAHYTATIHSLDGKTITASTQLEATNSPVCLPFNALPGYYILQLETEDAEPISLKIHKAN